MWGSTLFRTFKIDKNNYIGGGGFGAVYLAEKQALTGDEFDVLNFNSEPCPSFQKHFAIKIIPNFNSHSAFSEIESLSTLSHPNVVKCYNAWSESDYSMPPEEWEMIKDLVPTLDGLENELRERSDFSSGTSHSKWPIELCVFLQYEFCTGGTLQDLLNKRTEQQTGTIESNLTENFTIFSQIVEGLVYLDFNSIVHSDMKPANIFLIKYDDRVIAKIGDFGFSYLIDYQSNSDAEFDPSTARTMRRLYSAPEYLKGIYTIKGDVHATGLMALALWLSSHYQFDEPIQINKIILAVMAIPNLFGTLGNQVLERFRKEHSFEWKFFIQLMEPDYQKRLDPYSIKCSKQMSQLCHDEALLQGPKISPSVMATQLQFAEVFLNMIDLKNAYLHLTQLFYHGFRQLETTNRVFLYAIDLLIKVAKSLGKFQDIIYIENAVLERINSQVEDNYRYQQLLDWQMLFYTSLVLYKTSLPEFFQNNVSQLFFKIIANPLFPSLDMESEQILYFEECLCSDAIETITSISPISQTHIHVLTTVLAILEKIEKLKQTRSNVRNQNNVPSYSILKAKTLTLLNKLELAASIYMSILTKYDSTLQYVVTQTEEQDDGWDDTNLNEQVMKLIDLISSQYADNGALIEMEQDSEADNASEFDEAQYKRSNTDTSKESYYSVPDSVLLALYNYSSLLVKTHPELAKYYCEALCELVRDRKDATLMTIQAYMKLFEIYDILGQQEEIDLLIRFDYIRFNQAVKFGMVANANSNEGQRFIHGFTLTESAEEKVIGDIRSHLGLSSRETTADHTQTCNSIIPEFFNAQKCADHFMKLSKRFQNHVRLLKIMEPLLLEKMGYPTQYLVDFDDDSENLDSDDPIE